MQGPRPPSRYSFAMRGSGIIPFLMATTVFLIVAGAIGFAASDVLIFQETVGASVSMRGPLRFLWPTALWAAGIAFGALLVGWWPGRLLGGLLNRRGFVPVAALCLLPICLPAYLLYWCWWQAWPLESSLHSWLVERNAVPVARGVTLYIALVCWAWPIVAWCVAGSRALADRNLEEMHQLDGAPLLVRAATAVRESAGGLVVGFVIVVLFVFNNTTAFDIATVHTFGYELRALVRDGAPARQIVTSGWPGVVIAAAGVTGLYIALRRRTEHAPVHPQRVSWWSAMMAIPIWAISIGVPLWLLASNMKWSDSPDARGFTVADFSVVFDAYSQAAVNTASVAALAGGIGVFIAIGLSSAWSSRRPVLRVFATVQAFVWVLLAITPASVIAVLIESALNRPMIDDLAYRTFAAILFGYLARFGFVAVLLGVWISAREAKELHSMRELDGASSLSAQLQVAWPRWLAGGVATFAIVAVLSMSEVVVTAQVQPPGFDAIAAILLSNIHYQREPMVVLIGLLLFAIALLASIVAAIGLVIGVSRRQ